MGSWAGRFAALTCPASAVVTPNSICWAKCAASRMRGRYDYGHSVVTAHSDLPTRRAVTLARIVRSRPIAGIQKRGCRATPSRRRAPARLAGCRSSATRWSPSAVVTHSMQSACPDCLGLFAFGSYLAETAAAPHALVEVRRMPAGNRDRVPPLAGQNAGDQDNLTDVVATVAERALDRQRHRVRLAANRNALRQVARASERPANPARVASRNSNARSARRAR